MCAECLWRGSDARSSKARMHCAARDVWPSARGESGEAAEAVEVDAEGVEGGRLFKAQLAEFHCV